MVYEQYHPDVLKAEMNVRNMRNIGLDVKGVRFIF